MRNPNDDSLLDQVVSLCCLSRYIDERESLYFSVLRICARKLSFAKSFSYLQCRKMQELTALSFLPLISHSVKLLGKIRHRREIYRARYPTSLQHVQI